MDRPLWRMARIDGLAGGGWAIVGQAHHALVDGIAAIQVAMLLFDGVAGRTVDVDGAAGGGRRARRPGRRGPRGQDGRAARCAAPAYPPARCARQPRRSPGPRRPPR